MSSKADIKRAGAVPPVSDHVLGLPSLILFALFMVLVALLGGSSRPDPTQIVILRPAIALLLVPLFYMMSREALARGRAPLFLLLALALVMALQTVPLPPSVWHALPGREPVVALDRALGWDEAWRPLSLVPGRTFNALASLAVPLAACLMALVLRLDRATLLWAVFALGVTSAAIGLLQVSGLNFLYLYEFASVGSASGLFANRNHGATLALLTVLTAAYLRFGSPAGREGGGRGIILMGGAAIAVLSTLVSGSRAGLAGLVAVLVLFLAMGLAAGGGARRHGRSEGWLGNPRTRLMLAGAAVLLSLVAVVFLFALFDAIPALDRIAQKGLGDEMRIQLWPVVAEMVRTYSWAGIGFGAFEEAYHIHEPVALMAPLYVNQAHNDLAQFVIEGGAAGLVIVVAAAVWIGRTALRGIGGPNAAAGALFWFGVVLVLAAASAVDYPLRTPLMQLVAMFLLLAFAAGPAVIADDGNRAGGVAR